jgi:hypothetical protein
VKLRDAANYLDKKEKTQPQMWPTPTTQEIEHPDAELTETGRRLSRDGNGRLPSNSLPDKVRSEVKKSEEKLHLNPTWVEGMMGFPHGWTDLGNEESPE